MPPQLVEPFVAPKGLYPTYKPFLKMPVKVTVAECRRCGFEPEDHTDLKNPCPKCHHTEWERPIVPGSILASADRFL